MVDWKTRGRAFTTIISLLSLSGSNQVRAFCAGRGHQLLETTRRSLLVCKLSTYNEEELTRWERMYEEGARAEA